LKFFIAQAGFYATIKNIFYIRGVVGFQLERVLIFYINITYKAAYDFKTIIVRALMLSRIIYIYTRMRKCVCVCV
jgi:hypothetical protein